MQESGRGASGGVASPVSSGSTPGSEKHLQEDNCLIGYLSGSFVKRATSKYTHIHGIYIYIVLITWLQSPLAGFAARAAFLAALASLAALFFWFRSCKGIDPKTFPGQFL